MSALLALRYGLTPFHLIRVNPSLPFGGTSIASKFSILERFRGRKEFLDQALAPSHLSVSKRHEIAEQFIARCSLPIIAKPDRGVVGIGVRKISTLHELGNLLRRMPADYLLQEYCEYPGEYGVFYCKHPGQGRGEVISLTQKLIPTVVGDGITTVRQLIQNDQRYRNNGPALLKHAQSLHVVPKRGEVFQVIVQGSHTYGSIFLDRGNWITPALNNQMNELCSVDKDFCFGRFDLKTADFESLCKGDVKICELNGSMSEPIHIYDDRHTLLFGLKEFFRFYSHAYKIAKSNRNPISIVPYRRIMREYKIYLREKELVKQIMG